MNGELIYSYDVDITGVTDYGVTLESVLSGEGSLPPQGVRIDVNFEGVETGRLAGRITGTDFVRIRADGRIDLDIRATTETEDGHRIAVAASGVGVPRADEPIADLSENVTLTTAAADYAWVNGRQVWAVGTVNFATGRIHLDGYMQ